MKADEHIDIFTGERISGGNGNGNGGDHTYSLLAAEVVQLRTDLRLQTKVISANTNKVEAYIVRQDDVLKNHNKRVEYMERELLRLHNQQNSVVAGVQAALTPMGSAIGNLAERITKVDYYVASLCASVFLLSMFAIYKALT